MPCPSALWELPPLILHPFAKPDEAERMQSALGAACAEELAKQLLHCRYSEFRMLCFLGKDVARWMDQCMDFAARTPELAAREIRHQSFAALLVDDPPAPVSAKIEKWGVCDCRSIFLRAIGVQALFPDPPERGVLSEHFLRHYHVYADALFACRQQLSAFERITSREFTFQLYSSGEYSRMLEKRWSEPRDAS